MWTRRLWNGCVLYWSQDKVGIEEYLTGVDIHETNQTRFKLPSRLVAKTLLFRIIYGGTGYSMSTDPSIVPAHSEEWWNEIISRFYEKYSGLYAWHQRLYNSVVLDNGRLDLPTGRSYTFSPSLRRGAGSGSAREVTYPRTKILNYPVQGLAADLMAIARVSLYKRLKAMNFNGILWVNTVHDSIVLDIKLDIWNELCYTIRDIIEEVFRDIPKNFERLFSLEFNLPVRAEISYGENWKDMEIMNADRISSTA